LKRIIDKDVEDLNAVKEEQERPNSRQNLKILVFLLLIKNKKYFLCKKDELNHIIN